MVAAGARRAGGRTTAAAVATAQGQEIDQPVEEGMLPTERTRETTHTSFARMRLDWRGDDRAQLDRIKSAVDAVILQELAGPHRLIWDLYDVVRVREVDERTGEEMSDHLGVPLYQRTPGGAYVEDWSKLTSAQREDFLHRLAASLFVWEQVAADMQGRALYAKAIWEERFAQAFDSIMDGTVEDRRAVGNVKSAEDRYFAILQTHLSKRADAVVRSMNLLVRVLLTKT